MSKYEIFTDSSADLPKELIEQYDLKIMQLEVTIDGKEPVLNKDVDIKSFYNQLREGASAKTSAVTLGYFEEHMRAALEEGKDILYLGFSSGLSATYNNGVMMIKELEAEFPERKLYYIDTLYYIYYHKNLVSPDFNRVDSGSFVASLLNNFTPLT